MTVLQIQALLVYLGYSPGNLDGVWGPRTQAGARAFEGTQGLPELSAQALGEALLEAVKAGEKTGSFWLKYENFRRSEFRCPCGHCGGYPAEMEEGLIANLQALREEFRSPVTISSGVRCISHNRAVGGVGNSRHLLGKAADFSVRGQGSAGVLAACRSRIAAGKARYAYAIDENFVHLDIE